MAGQAIDTITAMATPPGRGGVAIVRVSGPLVKLIIAKLLNIELQPRQATLTSFYGRDDQVIDQGIAIFFPNPHSFTGEDVLELHGHGGMVVIDLLLKEVISLGARLARAGEFSERAFLNGKIDLTQAEAAADLINASSAQAARCAIRSLQGDFSAAIQKLKSAIVTLRSFIEAAIDFSDEEIDFLDNSTIKEISSQLLADLAQIQRQAVSGNLMREGLNVVIAGVPNVGKSSLLNALSGRDIAIVTDIPGTTRDILRNEILIDGLPLHLIDTAGLRQSDDAVEQEGIRRAYKEMENADLLIHLQDATRSSSEQQLPSSQVSSKDMVVISNKIDLINEPASITSNQNVTTIALSAKTGEVLDLFKQHIKSWAGFDNEGEGNFLARRRHLDALARVEQHIKQSLAQLGPGALPELAAEDLRLAQLALNEITGEFTSDDLLGHIFASFCIGK